MLSAFSLHTMGKCDQKCSVKSVSRKRPSSSIWLQSVFHLFWTNFPRFCFFDFIRGVQSGSSTCINNLWFLEEECFMGNSNQEQILNWARWSTNWRTKLNKIISPVTELVLYCYMHMMLWGGCAKEPNHRIERRRSSSPLLLCILISFHGSLRPE